VSSALIAALRPEKEHAMDDNTNVAYLGRAIRELREREGLDEEDS
jgi:hypothetical protein